MDLALLDQALQLRAMERIIITIMGGLCIYLGYKLFQSGVNNVQEAEWSTAGASFKLTRVSPGSFFAVVGAIILFGSTNHALTMKESSTPTLPTSAQPSSPINSGKSNNAGPATTITTITYVGGVKKLDRQKAVNTIVDLLLHSEISALNDDEKAALVQAALQIKLLQNEAIQVNFGHGALATFYEHFDSYSTGGDFPEDKAAILEEMEQFITDTFLDKR